MNRAGLGVIALLVAGALVYPTIAQSDRMDDMETRAIEAEEARDGLASDVAGLREQVRSLGEVPVVPAPDDEDVERPPVVIHGEDGEDGKNGKDGIDGINGINGIDGADGTDGANGTDGTDGAPGSPPSDEQIAEVHAAYCAVNNCTGPEGPQGEPGPQGDPGPAGPPPAVMNFSLGEQSYVCTLTDAATATYDCVKPPPQSP